MNSNYFIMVLLNLLLFNESLVAQYSKTAACSNPAFDKKVHSYLNYAVPVIGVKEAYSNKSGISFLDAREIEEYQVSHIPGARYVGYEKFNIENLNHLSKENKIVVYCSIGYRSEKIAAQLKKAGFKNVFNLYGSIFEWANAGYELIGKDGKPIHKIHTYNKNWSQWVFNTSIEKIW